MSEASAEAYEPGERDVCISIRDPAAPLPVLGRLRELYPTLPILRLSGSHGAGGEEMPSGVTTLYKPFEIEGLLDVVRSILR